MIWAGEHYVTWGSNKCRARTPAAPSSTVVSISASRWPSKSCTCQFPCRRLANLTLTIWPSTASRTCSSICSDMVVMVRSTGVLLVIGRAVIRTACCLAFQGATQRRGCSAAAQRSMWQLSKAQARRIPVAAGIISKEPAARSRQANIAIGLHLHWNMTHPGTTMHGKCHPLLPSLKASQSATRTNLIQIANRVRDCAAV